MGEAYGAFDYYFPKPGAVVTFEYEAGVTEGARAQRKTSTSPRRASTSTGAPTTTTC